VPSVGSRRTQQQAAERRLARSGLADDAQRLARIDVEIHAVDRAHLRLPRREHAATDAEVALQPARRDQSFAHIRAFGPLVTMHAARCVAA
jgi:hypothetical protein